MKAWGNNLYVILNSFSTEYSTNSSQTDIYYYRLRVENGYVMKKVVWGSPTDDFAYSIETTFNGIYLLAKIGDGLLPHKDVDKTWSTLNDKSNLAIIFIDFEDSILEIEGYDY